MDGLENYPTYIRVFFSQEDGNIEWVENIATGTGLLHALLTLTATLGNGMLIVAISRSQNLQTPSYLLITSLAFTDLLVGLVFHPLQISISLFYFRKDVKAVLFGMEFLVCISMFLGITSSLMMTCISIDRYLALRLKHRYRVIVTKKRVRLLIVIVWSFCSLLTTPITFWRKPGAAFCASFFCLNFLFLSITCVFYIKMFKILHLYTVQVQAQQPNPLAGNFDLVRYKKTLKTMLVVLGCFLLCSVPTICVALAMAVVGFNKETILPQAIALATLGLNSSINPVIYVIRFADIRNAYREMLRIGN